ncbi:MAG: hypothetical protein ACR652_17720 [Methylocystis sp.]|uniref:hypothetical protein n=1 Tax=Methylocystis sp. TaxID=1911079 RepID=UPI003DA336CD
MGLLNGDIAAAFAGVFGGIYLDGELYRPNAFSDDGKGGGPGGGFAEPEAVKVQIDAATQAMRMADGFVDSDQRILLLAHGVAAPDADCEIEAGGSRWMIESVGTDPAGSYYELRGRRKAGA